MNKNDRKVRLGVIGLGGRGRSLLRNLLEMEDVNIVAICDLYEDRIQESTDIIETFGKPKADSYVDYHELLTRTDIEGVIIATSIISHAEIAIAAMKQGIFPGMEVGGAASLEECWDLVRTSEQTGIPCMMLENCNYGRNELAVLNMVKQGVFGEVVHAQCGYEHDLRNQVAMGKEKRHNRYPLYMHRNGDNYPTHGLGPIAKCLNINRGNQFLTLSSISSKARGLKQWIESELGDDHPLAQTVFNQGDIITTMLKCAGGETILITLDTTLPRPYSRAGRIQGTKGIWLEDNNGIYIDGQSPEHEWEDFEKYRETYEHPLWKEFIQYGVRGGHGGMDYLCLRAYLESIVERIPPPIDVYDTAAWMAVTVLSEQSIALGGAPLSFPDFTNGKWIDREPAPMSKYALDAVHTT